jgi:predicted nucleic acid-binding protein
MRPEEVRTTAEFFDNLKYVEIDRGTARNAGELRAKWRRRGKTLSLPDAMIAAVALSLDLTLATDNAKDLPMPELRFLALPRD